MSNKISPPLGHDQGDSSNLNDRSLHLNNNAAPPEGSSSPPNDRRPEGRIPYNNNGNSFAITEHQKPKSNPTTSSFGTYDTLQITSQDYRDTDIRNLDAWTTLKVGGNDPYQFRKVLYLDHNGKETKHGDHVSTIGLSYHANHATTVVTIPSLPALVHGKGVRVLEPSDVIPAMDRVREAVSPYLDADLDRFKVNRLDSSTTFEVKEPTAAYIGFFHAITSPRQNRMDKKLYHGETVQFFNTMRSVGFYDKGVKELPEGLEECLSPDGDYLRFEVQDKISRAIAKSYGGLLFADIKAEATMAKAVGHRVSMFDSFFDMDAKTEKARLAKLDAARRFEDEYNLMKAIRDAGGRNGVLRFLAILELHEGITVERVLALMKAANFSRTHMYETKKKLEELAANWSSTASMFEEVRDLIHNDLKLVA